MDVRADGGSPGGSALGPCRRDVRRIAARVSSDYAVATDRADSMARSPTLPGTPAPDDFGVASWLKHYLGYGASKGGKDYAYVDLSERAIRELHLPPFAAGVAAGAPSVMPAFTTGPGGVPMSANRCLLQDVLRKELGFDGVLVSDYAGITEMRKHGTAADDLEAAVQAMRDGTMTVDMEDGVYYAQLARAVDAEVGCASRKSIAKCCARSRSSGKLGLFEKPYVPENLEKRVRVSKRTPRRRARDRAQVHRAAQERRTTAAAWEPRRILVTGPLADAQRDLLGPWHARGEAKDAVSVLAGIRERAAPAKRALSDRNMRREWASTRKGNAMDRGRRADRRRGRRRGRTATRHRRGRRTRDAERRSEESRASRPARPATATGRCAARTGKPVVVVLLTGRALAVPELVERLGRARARVFSRHRGRPRARRRAVRRLQPGRQRTRDLAAQRRPAADPSLRSAERPA